MQTARSKPVFFGREDTMLGICEAVGQDFGFNPNWLRVGFGLILVLNPVAVIASYFALGGIVLVSRLLVRNRVASAEAHDAVVTLPAREAAADPIESDREYALAA